MSFTYDPTLGTSRDQARFYVGDTDASHPLLSDEEYDAILTRYAYNIGLATILESLANKVSAYPNEYDESGRIKLSWRERGKAWLQNAKRLRDDDAYETIIAPQKDGIAIASIDLDSSGYRPHENTKTLRWLNWRP